MGDIALIFQNGMQYADIEIDPPSLKVDQDLQTAVIISLFTNRLADKDQVDEGQDRQGWWGDSYATVNGSRIGSRLWLLKRSKQLQSVANLARDYCYEALQWLIEDKIAESLTVRAEIIAMYTLGIEVKIVRPQDIQNFKFDYVWRQL
ncbi:MAG TPA: phage GP46 family protein [Hanamia sp.]|jgi:Mu-like prophage protein gp46|nr:phage GP46 family protein [Hanamia sp.]